MLWCHTAILFKKGRDKAKNEEEITRNHKGYENFEKKVEIYNKKDPPIYQ